MSRARLPRLALVVLALMGSGALALVVILPSFFRCARTAGPAERVASRVVERMVERAVERAVSVPAAHAQERMRFRRVPPESVAALERRRVRRARPVPADPSETSEPGTTTETSEPSDDHGMLEPVTPSAPSPPLPPTRADRSGDVMRIGSDVHVEEGEIVEGDVYALGGDVRIDGTVRGNVAATGGDVTLGQTAHIDGDVMCMGGKLTEEAGAFVGGQRVTALHDRPKRKPFEQHTENVVRRAAQGVSALIWMMIAMGAAWAITRFAPSRTGTALATLKREPGMCLVVGLVVLLLLAPSAVAMALIVAILCITIIGIPLGIGVVLAYAGVLAILALWGWVIGAIPVGQMVAQRATHQNASLTRGAVIGMLALNGLPLASAAFHVVPFFGWAGNLLWIVGLLGTITVTLLGIGSLIRSRIGQGPGGQWWPLTKRAAPVTVPGSEAVGPAPSYPPPPTYPPPPAPSEPPPAPIG